MAILHSYKSSLTMVKKVDWLTTMVICAVVPIASCSFPNFPLNSRPFQINRTLAAENNLESDRWRQATSEEQQQAWDYILNSPLGIAALNQLAIEGFISATCPKTFYINKETGGFQTLLKVRCSDGRGISASTNYQEMQVVFDRFEDNIENFQIQRIFSE